MQGLTNPLSRINVKSPFCISSTFVKVGGTTVFFSRLSCKVFCTEVSQAPLSVCNPNQLCFGRSTNFQRFVTLPWHTVIFVSSLLARIQIGYVCVAVQIIISTLLPTEP